MNARRHNLANVLATGVVVIVLMLTGLFWARCLCGTVRHSLLLEAAPEVRVDLSRLFFPAGEGHDPNLVSPCTVTARTRPGAPLWAGLGLAHYVQSRLPTGPDSHVYDWRLQEDGEWIYFDPTLGQIVYKGTKKVSKPDGKLSLVHFMYYAGPEGVAVAPDEKLGRFIDPIVDRYRIRPWVVYDRGLDRFLAVDWEKQAVRKGPEFDADRLHIPVQMGLLEKNMQSVSVVFTPGSYRNDARGGPGREFPANVMAGPLSMTNNTLVLDASGRIRQLDVDTLEFVGREVRLLAPRGLYSQGGTASPRDVAAYSVLPIHSRQANGAWACVGCAVATLSGDATSTRVEVYDPNGQVATSGETTVPQYMEVTRGNVARRTSLASTEAAYFHLPGAYGLTAAKLALETLHPPVLQLLSCFPASQFEATAGYRSLFLLPDSFLAMRARAKQGRPVEEFLASIVFAIPALVLALLLAWRVDRDGGRLGLSKDARTAWVVGTIIIGLPAYITYRLTRPKATLVTCANCGLGRRPDMEKCHHCGSPWSVPDLTPPTWRVIGEPEPAADRSPAPVQQADSSTQ